MTPGGMSLLGKQAGPEERIHQVSPVGQQGLFHLMFCLFVLGERGVGDGAVFRSSPLFHSHLGRGWEMQQSPKSSI